MTHSQAQEWVYTARPGDTLSDLAVTYLAAGYDASSLQAHNGLVDPNYLPTGTRLRIPVAWLQLQPVPATLVGLAGEVVRIRDDGKTTEPLAIGVKLHAGDTLSTGGNGSAIVEFADRSRMLLQPDSSVTLDALSAMNTTGMVDTSMRLHRGRLENNIEPLENPDSRYRVVTPPAVAAVRGTEFRVGYDTTTELMRGEVADGTIGVTAQGVSQEIPAGFGLVTPLGEPPGEPTALLPAPDVSQLPARFVQTQIEFSWPTLAGAVAYRANVLGGEQFDQLLRTATADNPSVTLTPLNLGRYLLQLRAIDGVGLAGADARHGFVVEPLPLAPLLVAPPDLSDWRHGAVTLRWSVPPDAQRFHLQVARDREFTELFLDRFSLQDFGFKLPHDTPSGHYYWRVASFDQGGNEGSFTHAREFTVHAQPAPPRVRVAAQSTAMVAFSWAPVTNAGSYRLQLSRSPRFHNVTLDIELVETQLRIATPPWGGHFFRVQSIGETGMAGPFGTARPLRVPAWLPAPQVFLLISPVLILLLVHFGLRRRS